MAVRPAVVPFASAVRQFQTWSARRILISFGVLALIGTLLTAVWANYAFGETSRLITAIVTVSAAKVDASEAALAQAAAMSNNAGLLLTTATDDPLHWSSIDLIRKNYTDIRASMADLRANLSTDEERALYKFVDYFVFDAYAVHIGNLLTAQQNGDSVAALKEYLIAGNYLQNQVARYLLNLETLNFNLLVSDKSKALASLSTLLIVFVLSAVILAVGLTALSFWARRKVRRFITPGLDIAMIIGWVLLIILTTDQIDISNRLRRMVDDAYLSVTAGARIVATANQINNVQNSLVLDPGNAAFWNSQFDSFKNQIESRLCGPANCSQTSFLTAPQSDTVAFAVFANSKKINNGDFKLDAGLLPMIGNVTFAGEANALENARIAFADYVAINAKVRDLVKNNAIEEAGFRISRSSAAGYAGEAFQRLLGAMDTEKALNKAVFDNDWNVIQGKIARAQLLLIFFGYVTVFAMIILGVVHRGREL